MKYWLAIGKVCQYPNFHKLILAFGLTDEIFGVSVRSGNKLNYFYSYGAMTIALPAWVLGTVFGVILGDSIVGKTN